MKWMKDPLAGFISRCGARMGKFTALLVTIAMLAGTTGAGATAFADETVTDGGNVAAESAASQPESTQQSDAENAVGSDVADIAGQHNRDVPEIDMDVRDYLAEQPWPGNVRQLRHVVERALVFADEGRLKVADFERGTGFGAKKPHTTASAPSVQSGATLKDTLEALEAKLINDAIIRFKGNKKKAAEHLGVSRSYLYKKLESS